MLSALTEVLHKSLTSIGNQLHEHSKCQMEQDNKLKEAVTLLISSHNVNSLAARSTSENFQRQKILRLQILGRMMGRMKDGIRLISMKCIVTTAGKPEDDPMMGLVSSEEVTKIIQLPI